MQGNHSNLGQAGGRQHPFGLAMFILRVWGVSLEVFLHRGMGDRYLGNQAAAVLLLVPLYASFWKGYDVRPLLYYLVFYVLACWISRWKSARARARGELCHSRYSGWPRFLGPKARVDEITMKRFYEPAMACAIGWTIRYSYNVPLGTFVMIGSWCLFSWVGISHAYHEAKARDLNDAAIEQELLAGRFREMRGRQW